MGVPLEIGGVYKVTWSSGGLVFAETECYIGQSELSPTEYLRTYVEVAMEAFDLDGVDIQISPMEVENANAQ